MDRITRHPMMLDIPFETAIEYAVDFIDLLGVPAIFDEKTAVVRVDDWQGDLPCDLVEVIQVRVSPRQHCSRWKSYRFHNTYGTYRASEHSFHLSDFKADGKDFIDLTYKIQNSVIITSTKGVDLEIAYRGFAVDDEGYPLLPDNASFLRGLEAYIKMKWFEIKYDQGVLPHDVMERVDREYCWAVGDAQSEFSRLDLDHAETLFNSFKTLLPRNNEHWKQFFTMGSKEIWKVQ